MKALSVFCTLVVLFNLAPLNTRAEDLSLPASIAPSGTLMQVNTSVSVQPASSADPGTIAYVRRSTHDIHLISPDGTDDRVLWTAPRPLSLYPAYDLAWRPDGRELAFSSEHEETCSLYQSDVYAIGYDGSGYRRVTNSPACAALAALPKGSVEVNVTNSAGPNAQVYVQGAPSAKFAENGTMRFDNVADFGSRVLQPAVGIYIGAYGEDRTEGYPPYADVQPNQTVFGGDLDIPGISGVECFGTGKVSWKAGGSALAYGMRTYSRISQISASPPYGSIGVPLPVVEHTAPYLVAWGPTTATKDQYLYSSRYEPVFENLEGIYLNTVGNVSGGTKLVPISAYYGGEEVYDIEWLPDASGFLFTKRYVNLGIFTDIFEYNFATEEISQLTYLPDDEGARGISISPDGQYIVFEWVTEVWDPTSSLWIVNRDGSGLRKLADDAGRPAWGRTPSLPAPTITSLNPSSAIAGGSAFALTVNGTGFVSGSVVRWNGSNRATTYVNNTRLTASIPAADIVAAGSASVTVFSPAPGGGTSNTATFSITDLAALTFKLYLPLLKH
jgi:TolB protein